MDGSDSADPGLRRERHTGLLQGSLGCGTFDSSQYGDGEEKVELSI